MYLRGETLTARADVTGVVADFTAPLKQAGVGVFVASTWCVARNMFLMGFGGH